MNVKSACFEDELIEWTLKFTGNFPNADEYSYVCPTPN